LWNSEGGQTIGLPYFRERGYLNPIIERFQLGFCPEPDNAFSTHAVKNGYSKELLMEMGLCKEGKTGLFDFYHGRVMFPIHSVTGHVLGFGGRTLFTDKKIAKYFNSPESEIYQKKDTLYGIYFAKSAIVKEDNCILVEGYFDVLRMHQIGIENVVASSGTSLTQEQIKLVKRYTKNITMLYDGDAAGLHAALRGTDMILSEGMNVRVVVLPPEHDPDTFGRDYSVDEVRNYLKDKAQDFIRFKTELLLKDAANDPIKRGEVIRDIIESISVIPDNIFRITYIKECSRLLDMPEQTLINELNKLLRAKFKKSLGPEGEAIPDDKTVAPKQEEERPFEEQLPTGYYQERELVKLLLMYGSELIDDECEDENGQIITEKVSIAQLIIDDLRNDEIVFTDATNRKIFNIFDQAIDEGKFPDDTFFVTHEDPDIVQLTADLLSSPYRLDGWDKKGIFVKKEEQMLKAAAISSLYRYKDLIIADRIKAIEEALKATEKASDDITDIFALLEKQKTLNEIRVQINKILGIVIAK
ncbi:MAG: toprim domain-containing protein, partial [Bacteroidales bacterium]|nr:toprim domain-containing protein [Bacteroidales bacterium]